MALSKLRVACAVVVLGVATSFPAVLAAQTITLLHINDTHSHLDAWGPKDANLNGTVGGLPKVATLVKRERAVDPNALFVHAGDFMDGDLFFMQYHGIAELTQLQALGLDAMTLGNHEWAYGTAFLVNVLNTAWPGGASAVPIVETNLATCADLAPWNHDTVLKNVNGVTVGLFGVTPPGLYLARPTSPCVLQAITASSSAATTALRAAGAQVVIALSHGGMDVARSLATAVPGIDVIVNGHDNAVLTQPEVVTHAGGGATRIVSTGGRYSAVGRLRLTWMAGALQFVDYALVPADASVRPDPITQAAIDALKPAIVATYGDVFRDPLAWAETSIEATYDPRLSTRDTPLGNLFADAYRQWTGTDVALEAMGFLDDPLPVGWVTGADVFRAMGYGPVKVGSLYTPIPFRLVTFSMTGADLLRALNRTISMGGAYFPQVSGLQLDFDSRIASTPILPSTVRLSGKPLDPAATVTVTATQGVYSALGQLSIPMGNVVTQDISAFDTARALVKGRGKLDAAASNRLRDVAAIGPAGQLSALQYWNAGFDHYFLTTNAAEAAALDAGTIKGWTRFITEFKVNSEPGTDLVPVCRFFSAAFAPKSSHFFTAFSQECAAVKANPAWTYEGTAFYARLPAADGTCASGTMAIYRSYNGGAGGAPAHLFTPYLVDSCNPAYPSPPSCVREGIGTDGVAFCVPVSIDIALERTKQMAGGTWDFQYTVDGFTTFKSTSFGTSVTGSPQELPPKWLGPSYYVFMTTGFGIAGWDAIMGRMIVDFADGRGEDTYTRLTFDFDGVTATNGCMYEAEWFNGDIGPCHPLTAVRR